MKKYIFLTLLFTLIASSVISQQVCCPEFKLVTKHIRPCDPNECRDTATKGNANGVQEQSVCACKDQPQDYLIVPNLPGFTYNWTVTGGTIVTTPANPATIIWGNGSEGYFQVVITSDDGSCRDTIKQKICLLDTPTASITYHPNPVCINQPVYFSGASLTGGASYYWDFGDGQYSDLQNPPAHEYTASGNYSVVLTVSNINKETECGCKDTAMVVVNVLNQEGIDIHTDDCRKMLCPNDTIEYCTSTTGCSNLIWSVNGGSIIGSNTSTCVKITWDQPSTFPTSVTLNANCPNTCGNSATLNVPVLYPNLPIQGPATICTGSSASYSLPALPGTFYTWTISGGATNAGYDRNHNMFQIIGITPGSATITCVYNNPYTECSGTTTLNVAIKPKFDISGPTRGCTGNNSSFFVVGGGAANWTISPSTGFTSGSLNNAANIALNWNAAGTYTITATPVLAAGYCTPSATTVIEVYPTPVLNPIVGDLTVCPNQLYNYSVGSNVTGGSFTWSLTPGPGQPVPYGPNGSLASVVFSGAGPWTLQATQLVNGCNSITTLVVTKLPAPPAISVTSTSICSGGTITASVPGVVPPGGYTWSSFPGAVIVSGQGTTSAVFTINDNASITISSCGGSSSTNITATTQTVSITPTPGTCSYTLTASPPGGTYAWFCDGNPAGTGNPITVTQNGNYVVQATYGSCTAADHETVTNITPVVTTITASGSLCNGGSVILTATVTANCPGSIYTWSNGIQGNPITVTTPGSYYVTVTCSNGCTDQSNIITLACPPGGGNCINDLVISPSDCPNPVALTVNTPAGCTPVSFTWNFGEGSGGSTGNHLYDYAGTYTVSVIMKCSDGTFHCGVREIKVPLVAFFTKVVDCGSNGWNIHLQDASTFLPTYAGYSLLWSTSPCGSLSSTNSPNPTLTVPFGCNPTVTLQISKNGCTKTYTFPFNLPTTPLSILGPTTVCKGEIYSFSSSFNTGVLVYHWDFGDYTHGATNPISHAFDGTQANPLITLTITDQYGCPFTATKQITVITPTPLVIAPAPLVKICPDCLPPVTLSTLPATGYSSYQWYQNDIPITNATNSTYQLCNFNASGNYYVTAISNTNNCRVKSNSTMVVYKPKPIADIQGSPTACIGTAGNQTFTLNNSVNITGLTYLWTVTPPSVAIFSSSTSYSTLVSVNISGTYQFILTVTDPLTGCMAKDTFCVYVYKSPTVTIAPTGIFCEGISHTFTATALPPNPDYIYQWSNGAGGPAMTTAQAGNYWVTVVDPISGCSGSSTTPVTIRQRPYVDLFPLGCDTICDTLLSTVNLIPPLPLKPWQTGYNGVYTIQWYVNGNNQYTGPQLSLTGLDTGQYHINAIVNFNGDTCYSTSGYYDLYVRHCTKSDSCSCANSHWGKATTAFGSYNGDAVCGATYHPACNQIVNFDANYICDSADCQKKVTYTLQGPGGVTTGEMPLIFPATEGTFTLQTYGWCGDIICDSCKYYYVVECDSICCPQINEINVSHSKDVLSQQTYQGNNYSLFTTQLNIVGGTTPYSEVRADVIDFQLTANYNDCIDCTNKPFTWASLSATYLAGIQPSTSGVTPAVGYFVPSNIYGNPREVVWNNGSLIDLSSAQGTSMSFFLPPLSKIPCCALKAKVCVKFSFRDINCNLCEKVECFEIVIGDTVSQASCCCDYWNKGPVRIIAIKDDSERNPDPATPKPSALSVNCGASITLAPGKYKITAPTFFCNPNNAACTATYTWSIGGGSVSDAIIGQGTGNSFSFDFTNPGTYLVTITPKCGSCACAPCTFTIIIKPLDCNCGNWTVSEVVINWKDPKPFSDKIKCNDPNAFTISRSCSSVPVTGTFGTYICTPSDCQVKYSWVVLDSGNVIVGQGTNTTSDKYSFLPTKAGAYTLKVTAICGNKKCGQCVIKINIKALAKC